MALTRDDLVARLIRAGELEVSGGDQAEIDSYFDTRKFRFHGPDGFEADYAGLTNYFRSMRAAFHDRSIRRGIIVAEGNYIACQTWIAGRFVRQFAHSPAGTLPANDQRVVWDLMNIFRFDDQGRLVEEWAGTPRWSRVSQMQSRSVGNDKVRLCIDDFSHAHVVARSKYDRLASEYANAQTARARMWSTVATAGYHGNRATDLVPTRVPVGGASPWC
jgi:hypothetical protein